MRKLAIPVTATLIVTLAAAPASAIDEINTKRLRDAVTVNGIMSHERVLQRIANNNDGTRASGTPGYGASAAYVRDTLTTAGYQVTEQVFTFPFYRELEPARLTQVAPTPVTYETATYSNSGSGDVTGEVVPTSDVLIPPPATPGSTSGCEPGDFRPAAPDRTQIALIQRGTCPFEIKATNAQAAGYDAVIIFNEGQPDRQDLFVGDLGRPFTIPVVGVDFATGSALFTAGPVTVRVVTRTETSDAAKTSNIIAETPGGEPDRVLVVGAHLDSVVEGPGINDNGTGSSAILEIAVQLARLGITPRQKVRFAFWGAEENGLLGSEHYVAQLSDADLGDIFANLNFDMLGSPNYVRFVYDGDGSPTGTAGPPGSAEIEHLFTSYFSSQGLASHPSPFTGRSDYGPFIDVGIPAGGLFTGAEGIKTEAQAAVYGGTAGQPYDPCYHAACDTINNVNTRALGEMSDAAAHAVLTLARSRTGFFPDGSLRVRAAAPARDHDHDHHGSRPVR